MTPTVSICIPAYNAGPFLGQCLDSVLAQTFEDFEVVLVDNVSTDDTHEIALDYARRDARVLVHRNSSNIGPHGNFNRAIDFARGKWIKLLCADDWLEPQCLEKMVAVTRPGVLIIAGREELAFAPGMPAAERQKHLNYWSEHTAIPKHFPGATFIAADAFAEFVAQDPAFNAIGSPNAAMFHRSAFERFGRKRADLATHDDWEMAMRVAVHTGLGYVADVVAHFRQHHTSLSTTVFARQRFQMEIIAPLIVRHEVAFAPVYAPVRAAAARRKPPIDLRAALSASVVEADRIAHRFSENALDAEALSDWKQFIDAHPRLRRIHWNWFAGKVRKLCYASA